MSKQKLAEYINKCIEEAKNEDMVIPYKIDCYEFISSDTKYRDIKMKEGWKIIMGIDK